MHFSAKQIAAAAGTHENTVRHRAVREHWPRRPQGTLVYFMPPPALAAKCQARAGRDLAQLDRELLRAAAVCGFRRILKTHPHCGITACLLKCVREFKRLLPISERSLRVWVAAVTEHGLRGLDEKRKGHCGRKRKVTT